MNPEQRQEHLSHISTLWSVVKRAHDDGAHTQAGLAKEQLVGLYGPAIHRYLLAAARDADLADELFQEFALRLVRGDFRRADRSRGRFRQFLKSALYHLVIDAQRRQRRQPSPLPAGSDPPAKATSRAESDEQFVVAWRAELMTRAWEALERHDRATGQHLHIVLRYRRDHPDVRSPDMAVQLGPLIGKPISAEWVRKRLHLARERFAELLLDEVAETLDDPAPESMEEELLNLGLLPHCQAALARRRDAIP